MHTTREDWLIDVAHKCEPWFEALNHTIPRYRVTCGWTGHGKSKTKQGQCWSPNASADGTCEIFISPVIDDPLDACETLLHEMIHAAVGPEHKHNKVFKQVASPSGSCRRCEPRRRRMN